jgi:hypothetical protein
VLRTVSGKGSHAADGHDAHQPAVLMRYEVYSRVILQHAPQQTLSNVCFMTPGVKVLM